MACVSYVVLVGLAPKAVEVVQRHRSVRLLRSFGDVGSSPAYSSIGVRVQGSSAIHSSSRSCVCVCVCVTEFSGVHGLGFGG